MYNTNKTQQNVNKTPSRLLEKHNVWKRDNQYDSYSTKKSISFIAEQISVTLLYHLLWLFLPELIALKKLTFYTILHKQVKYNIINN